MSEETEFNHTLIRPFRYAFKGEHVEAQFIRLHAPTSRNRKECSLLKQAFFRAIKDAPDAPNGRAQADDQKVEGDDVMMLISMSQNVDLDAVLEAARKLFTSGVAQVDGEEKLTAHLIDQMSLEDLEKMVGDYLAFFTLRSALQKLSAN